MGDSEYAEANLTIQTSQIDSSRSTNKRRSAIFQRRSISHLKPDDTISTPPEDSEVVNNESSAEREGECFNLKEYISSLKDERKDWKKILNERRSQRRFLVKQESSLGDEVEPDLSVLAESQRAFLQARPNYAQISKNINNLVPVAVKIAQLNAHINHLNENLIECMEEKICAATKRVTELAED